MQRPDTCTEYLRYEFTPEEIKVMGQELAKQYDKNRQIEEEFNAVKAQFKERTAVVEQAIGKLSRLITTQFEMRNVECRLMWHTPCPGFVTIVRTDTGEVIKERVMTLEERQELLPFPDKRDRTIPKPEKVRGALAQIGEDTPLDEVSKWSDTDLILVLEWAEALKNAATASESATDGKPTETEPIPARPMILMPMPTTDQVVEALKLFRMDVPLEQVEALGKEDRYAVIAWITAVLQNERGGKDPIPVPPRPEVLADFKRSDVPPAPKRSKKNGGSKDFVPMTDAEVEENLRSQLAEQGGDDEATIYWPDGSTPEQCERILAKINEEDGKTGGCPFPHCEKPLDHPDDHGPIYDDAT